MGGGGGKAGEFEDDHLGDVTKAAILPLGEALFESGREGEVIRRMAVGGAAALGDVGEGGVEFS